MLTISQILFAAIFVIAGIGHWLWPKFFLHIMPLWVPARKWVNLAVGLIEILLGAALLFPPLKPYAAWGLVALLIAVFPANVNHFHRSRKHPTWFWITLLRLPVQPALIYWAYSLT